MLPQLADFREAAFVSVKNGELVKLGRVVYVGKDVTPEMMLDRFCKVCPISLTRSEALRRLEVYTEALHKCKVGNLLSVTYTAEGLPVLKVELEHFIQQPVLNLP